MAEAFLGMTISVTLQSPPGAVLIGRVLNVIAGQTLQLEHVFFPQSGHHVPLYNVPAHLIADLHVVEATSKPNPPPAAPAAIAANSSATRDSNSIESPVKPQSFVDPAILSFSKSPAPAARSKPPPPPPPAAVQEPSPVPVTPSKSVLSAAAAASLPTNTSPFVAHAPEPLTRQEAEYIEEQAAQSAKKTRRGRRNPRNQPPPVTAVTAATEVQTVKETLSPNVSRNGNDMTITPSSGKKGWRSTPLLKEHIMSAKDKKKSKRQVDRAGDQNGWATEEATDIQDLGDFDFEANLSKFDKRTVFDQIRNEDTTADEDRLVSHNRLARPGTYGGKNLHPTEMVLSPSLKPKYHSSDLESTSDADTELNFGSGTNSKRAPSRTSNKRPSRLSTSGLPEDILHPLSASLASSALNRSMSSLRGSSVVASSPNPARARSPQSAQSPMPSLDQLSLSQQQAAPRPHFKTPKSKYPCSVFHPDRLRQVEADAISNIGISADAITENAARGIAESVLASTIKPGASRRNSKITPNLPNPNSKPVVVILAGNHITGARAIASARHLYSRGFKVLISVLDFSTPSIWHPQLAKHIHSLQALGRKAARIEGWRSTSGHIKRLEGPPAIILDALLDGQRYADIRDDVEKQTEAREMIDWANRSRAGVVSINIPSGFDSVDGTNSVVEGEPLAIRPEAVLALGVPLLGLLEAMKEGEGSAWGLTAVDTGINVVLGDREKVMFGTDWNVGFKFFAGEQP